MKISVNSYCRGARADSSGYTGYLGKQVIEVKPSNKRTNKVRLLPKGSTERKLRKLGDLFAKAFNELNFMGRDLFW